MVVKKEQIQDKNCYYVGLVPTPISKKCIYYILKFRLVYKIDQVILISSRYELIGCDQQMSPKKEGIELTPSSSPTAVQNMYVPETPEEVLRLWESTRPLVVQKSAKRLRFGEEISITKEPMLREILKCYLPRYFDIVNSDI